MQVSRHKINARYPLLGRGRGGLRTLSVLEKQLEMKACRLSQCKISAIPLLRKEGCP